YHAVRYRSIMQSGTVYHAVWYRNTCSPYHAVWYLSIMQSGTLDHAVWYRSIMQSGTVYHAVCLVPEYHAVWYLSIMQSGTIDHAVWYRSIMQSGTEVLMWDVQLGGHERVLVTCLAGCEHRSTCGLLTNDTAHPHRDTCDYTKGSTLPSTGTCILIFLKKVLYSEQRSAKRRVETGRAEATLRAILSWSNSDDRF
ncbi:hypothetical protein J6590_104204, partial [Homalodisca vitripennis]